MEFSTNLKDFRNAKGLTQEELAEYVGITRQMISGMEKGVKEPNLTTLLRIAEVLKVTPNDLCGIISTNEQ